MENTKKIERFYVADSDGIKTLCSGEAEAEALRERYKGDWTDPVVVRSIELFGEPNMPAPKVFTESEVKAMLKTIRDLMDADPHYALHHLMTIAADHGITP